MRPGPLLLVLATLAAGACKPRSVQAVADAYAPRGAEVELQAATILFVPGILGSELHLRDSGRVVWGTFGTGQANPSAHPDDLRAFALPVVLDGDVTLREDPEVEPGGELLGVELKVGRTALRARAYPGVFEGLMETLAAGGTHVHRLALDAAVEGRSPLHAVGYDWRRSVTAETGWFHADVLQAVEARRAAGLDPRVDIVAHSMGTQLVRWYLRHGPGRLGPEGVERDSDEPWDPSIYVRQVLLIAPPNLGEPSVLDKLIDGERPNGLLPLFDPVVTMSFPALYEMLPRPGTERVVWADTGEPVDLYDVTVWESLGWGAFAPTWDEHLAWWLPEEPDRAARLAALRTHVAASLHHARRLHEAMADPLAVPSVPVHVFVGTSHPTPGVLRVDRTAGARSWSEHVDGDGTVARASAVAAHLRPWTSVHFVPADHMSITAAPGFLEDALYLLLAAREPAAAP